MALAIFLSYGLQFYVPINIIGPWFRSLFSGEFAQQISDVALRTTLVVFTCKLTIPSNRIPLKFDEKIISTVVLAAIVPNLGPIISLVGAVSSSTLALIFPPLIEIITFWPNKLGRNNWILWKDIGIMIFGIAGFVFGTYASVMEILDPQPQAAI